jgi:hypothetical protein
MARRGTTGRPATGPRSRAAVGFDDADDDVVPIAQLLLGGAQHGVGLADARAHAEEHLEPAAAGAGLVALERGEQRVGIGTVVRMVGGAAGGERRGTDVSGWSAVLLTTRFSRSGPRPGQRMGWLASGEAGVGTGGKCGAFAAVHGGGAASRARLRRRTLTPGSPSTESAGRRCGRRSGRDRCEGGRPRARATRGPWSAALAG